MTRDDCLNLFVHFAEQKLIAYPVDFWGILIKQPMFLAAWNDEMGFDCYFGGKQPSIEG